MKFASPISRLVALALLAVMGLINLQGLMPLETYPPAPFPKREGGEEVAGRISKSMQQVGDYPTIRLPGYQTKIAPEVLAEAAEGPAESLVLLAEQADLSGAAALPTRAEKGAYVYARLTETARRSQAPLLAYLQARGIAYRALWISNVVWVRAGRADLQAIAARPEVARLAANLRVQMALPPGIAPGSSSGLPDYPTNDYPTTDYPTDLPWNLLKVRAPEAWAAGFTGQGVVIGGQDTGYDWTHPALMNAYRGWNGGAADHDYNWFDATLSDPKIVTNDCRLAPCDPYGHGTHTMGIMLGDDGAGNQVGMAPQARWIGCRNMNASGAGSPLTYLACYQWFIAPTDVSGNNPRPDLAPDVINNSWSCPISEGCTDPEILHDAVRNVRAAGILTAHSAGNRGPGCGTISEPAATYPESFTVSNTQSDDSLNASSSRGPEEGEAPKPDIAAPGTSIYSSLPDGGYGWLTGTSMAAPHVAGLAALVISANPALSGQVDQIEAIIEQTAVQPGITVTCSQAGQSPNSDYGWGRIDAYAAVQAAGQVTGLGLTKTASLAAVQPGQALTYTLTVAAGPAPATGLTLTDTLPAQTTLLGASEPYTFAAGVVTWALPDLAAGASTSVQLIVQADSNASGAIVNESYGVASNADARQGLPVVTPIVRRYYYPFAGR